MFKALFLAIVIVFLCYQAGTILFIIANNMYADGKREKALSLFAVSYKLRLSPYNRAVYGALLLKNGKADEARKVLNLVVMKKPKAEVLYYAKSILALLAYKEGRVDEAFEIYDEILEKYKNSFHLGNAGSLYNSSKPAEEALAFNKSAYEYNNENVIILDNLADSYLRVGDTENAGEIFEALMAKKPQFPDAYYHYAQYLIKIGEKEKAQKNIEISKSFPLSYISPISNEDILALEELAKG